MSLHLAGVVLPAGEWRELWVHEGRITFERVAGAQTVTRSGWILPGLVDVHCHIGLSPAGHADRAATLTQAHTERDAGVLLVRDAGSPVDTRWLSTVEDAPDVVRAGRHIAAPRRYIRDLAVEVEPAQLSAEVTRQAARGDGWVKIVGDWIDRDVGDLAPEWPAEAVRAAVRAAHAAGARIAVHTFGEEALPDLLAAGVDSVEHGTGLSEDLIAVMAEHGTALVPTLINIDNFPGIADSATRFPVYAARMRRLYDSSRPRVRAAYEAGVPIFAGTDAGSMLQHGRIAEEIRALHEAGLSTVDALGAASWRAREWLGRRGIEEGAPADLVVYESDPRADLSALVAPGRIVLKGQLIQ